MGFDRGRRALDAVAVLVAGAVALRWPIVALIVALALGSVSRWSRGDSWSSGRPVEPLMLAGGIVVGLAALLLGVMLADPLLTSLTGRSVEWSQVAAVRGQFGAALVVGTLACAQVVAAELVLRRWVLERAREVVTPGAAIVIATLAEAWLVGGSPGTRAGAAAIGLACGLLYIGSGGRLAPSLAARVTFELGALALVWQQVL